MMHYYYGPAFGWGLGGVILMFILAVLVIVLLVWAISSAGRRHHYYDHFQGHDERGPRNSGLDILNERYAKGEITKEEYEQKKKDIIG